MDGPCRPTPEWRWRERTWSEAEGRMVGASVFAYFCPGRAAAIGKSESPGWAKQKSSEHSISSQGTDKGITATSAMLGFAIAQPNLRRSARITTTQALGTERPTCPLTPPS